MDQPAKLRDSSEDTKEIILPHEHFDAALIAQRLKDVVGEAWWRIFGLPREIPKEDVRRQHEKELFSGMFSGAAGLEGAVEMYLEITTTKGVRQANIVFPGFPALLGYTKLEDLPRVAVPVPRYTSFDS